MNLETISDRLRRLSTDVKREETLTLAVLVVGALAVRLLIMLSFQTYQFPTEKSMGAEMGWIARSLVNGEGFRVGDYYAWMPPLYPFILSLIFRLFGSYSLSSGVAILVLQSIVSSLVVLPLYFIGKELFGRGVGFVAGWLWVFHPGSIAYAVKHVWSSSFTALGVALVILLFFQLSRRPARFRNALLAGLVVGLTALDNPVILIFAPFAALWLLWRSPRDIKMTAGLLTLVGSTATAIIMPWTIRNYMIFDQFVPIKSTFGVNLWQGNYGSNINQPTAGLKFWERVEHLHTEEEVAHLLSFNEVERAAIFRERVTDYIFANPRIFMKYVAQRAYLFWRFNPIQSDGIFLMPVYLLAWIGVIASKQYWRDTVLLLLLLAIFPIPYYLTIADTYRYRFPIDGLLLVFVAYGLSYLLSWIRRFEPHSASAT